MPLDPKSIDASFSKPDVRVRDFNPLYGIGLFMCTIGSVILFAAYLLIVAAVAGLLVLVVKDGFPYILRHYSSLYIMVGMFLIFGVLALSLGKLTWLLVRTFFVRRPERQAEIEITDTTEPLLLYFFQRVAKSVGAKPPTKVILTGGTDASASLGNFLQSIFGRTRVLRLGMCLFPAMSITQLGGLVAHECGHFTQFFGMRMQALVFHVTDWFRISVHSIIVDRILSEEKYANHDGSGFTFDQVNNIACGFVYKTLDFFLEIATLISAFASRRMEFSADKFQTVFCGSPLIEETFNSYHLTEYAFEKAVLDCQRLLEIGELPDDFPLLVKIRLDELTNRELNQVKALQKTQKPSVYDTHPGIDKRIRTAMKRNKPGLFSLQQPGTELFEDFHARSKFLTYHFYDAECGLPVCADQLVPLEEFAAKSKGVSDAIEKVNTYGDKSAKLLAPFPVNCGSFEWSKAPIPQLAEQFLQCSAELYECRETFENAQDDLQYHLNEQLKLRQAEAIDHYFGERMYAAEIRQDLEPLREDIRKDNREAGRYREIQSKLAFISMNLLARPELCPQQQKHQSLAYKELTGLLSVLHHFNQARSLLLEIHGYGEIFLGLANAGTAPPFPPDVGKLIISSKSTREKICSAFDNVLVPYPGDQYGNRIGKSLKEELEQQITPSNELDAELILNGVMLSGLTSIRITTIQRLEYYLGIIPKLLPNTTANQSAGI